MNNNEKICEFPIIIDKTLDKNSIKCWQNGKWYIIKNIGNIEDEKMNESLDKETLLQCKCGCGIVGITECKEENETFISYYIYAGYSGNAKSNIIESIKLIWSIIRGKRYTLYEAIIDQDEWNKIKE